MSDIKLSKAQRRLLERIAADRVCRRYDWCYWRDADHSKVGITTIKALLHRQLIAIRTNPENRLFDELFLTPAGHAVLEGGSK